MRLIVPAVAALVIVGLVAARLWQPGLYFGVMNGVAAPPFEVPFIDLHAVFSAFECHRQGVDVLRINPCDFHGRQHVYSPLWLPLAASGLGVRHTVAGGLVLAALYVLSLALLFRPRQPWQVGVALATVLSPGALFALERGNNDLVVMLLMIPAAHLIAAAAVSRRGLGYGLVMAAGFLKYYPWIGLTLLLTERPRHALLAAGLFAALLAGFVMAWRADLAVIAGNVPITDGLYHIAARNLWLSFRLNLPPLAAGLVMALVGLVFAMLVARLSAAMRRHALVLDTGRPSHVLLLLGGLLLTGCFFTGSSLPYRAVLLVLTLPALLELATAHPSAAARRFASRSAVLLAALPWTAALHQALATLGLPGPAGLVLALKEMGWWLAAALFASWTVVMGQAAISARTNRARIA